jgi:predicted ATPase
MTDQKSSVPMLVITGGPCAGKSTIMMLLETLQGDKVELVPEAATQLRGEGYVDPPDDPAARTRWMEDFQQAVATRILKLEAEAQTRALDSDKLLLVCDRGLADGFAYHPRGWLAVTQTPVFTQNRLTHPKTVLNRYHAVIHMESLAVHNPLLYQTANNTARYETVEQAVAVDQAIQLVWHSHHSWNLVCNEHLDFRGVNNAVLGLVSPLIRKLETRNTPYWRL